MLAIEQLATRLRWVAVARACVKVVVIRLVEAIIRKERRE